MSEALQFNLSFEPNGESFIDNPESDGSLYAVHAGRPVAVNDGQLIASKDMPNSSISVSLKAAQHGTFSGSPASLLLFEFKFGYSRKKYRIKYATIDIEFKYSQIPRPPHVHSFCPWNVLGDETSRTITSEFGAGLSAGIGQAFGVNFSASRTEEVERSTRFTLTSAITKTHSGGLVTNGVRWVLTENENSQSGVPYFVPIALLVQRKVPYDFFARINIDAKMAPGLHPKTWFGMSAGVPRLPIDVKAAIGRKLEESGDMFDAVDLETLVELPNYM